MLSEIVKNETPPEALNPPVDQPEVTAEATQETKPEQEEKHVPLAALHEERSRRKEMQNELRQLREVQAQQAQLQQQRDQEWQVAQQRIQALFAARQTPTPDKDADPLAYVAHKTEQTQAQLQEMRMQQAQREQWEMQQRQMAQQRAQQEQQTHQLVTLTTQSEQAFAKEKPDYQEAVTFLKSRRIKELIAAGYEPEAAGQYAQQEGWNLAHQWLTQGRNPAAMAYHMATATGYTPKTVDANQRLEMQEAGQRAAKPSGGAGKVKTTVEALAQMSPTQLARMSDEEFRAVMGG